MIDDARAMAIRSEVRKLLKGPLLKGGSHLYGLAGYVREVGYGRGALPVRRIPGLFVISIGNLRVGGTGKTPFAIWLVNQLRARGLSTALISRGYRGKWEKRGGLVSRGRGPLCTVEEAGDEAFMAATQLRDASVWVGADRVASARRAKAAGAAVAVLDDGFQHRRIQRDLDLLLVSPADLDGTLELLPLGPLRERAGAARRADLMGGFAEDWQENETQPDFLIRYVPQALHSPHFGPLPLPTASQLEVYLLSGVARPQRFRETCLKAGLSVVGASIFPDHHFFNPRELKGAVEQAEAVGASLIVTTEKDLVRMGNFSASIPIVALQVQLELLSRRDILEEIVSRIEQDKFA